MSASKPMPAGATGTIDLGGDLTVNRLGFGSMRITGAGICGPPPDRDEATAVLRREDEENVAAAVITADVAALTGSAG